MIIAVLSWLQFSCKLLIIFLINSGYEKLHFWFLALQGLQWVMASYKLKWLAKIGYTYSTLFLIQGYIYVGDRCWRQFVMITSSRCWWTISNWGQKNEIKSTKMADGKVKKTLERDCIKPNRIEITAELQPGNYGLTETVFSKE